MKKMKTLNIRVVLFSFINGLLNINMLIFSKIKSINYCKKYYILTSNINILIFNKKVITYLKTIIISISTFNLNKAEKNLLLSLKKNFETFLNSWLKQDQASYYSIAYTITLLTLSKQNSLFKTQYMPLGTEA